MCGGDGVVRDECTALANGINEDGLEVQVKYLLSNGWTEEMILEKAGLVSAPSAPSHRQ